MAKKAEPAEGVWEIHAGVPRAKKALRKIGAVKEGLLRKSLRRNGELLDQVLYTVLDSDWRESRPPSMAANALVH